MKKALLLILAAVTMLALVQPAWAQVNRSQTITLNFVGDILLASRIRTVGRKALARGWRDLSKCDFTIGNLNAPLEPPLPHAR